MNKTLLALGALSVLGTVSALSAKHERGTLDRPGPVRWVMALEYSFVDTLLALGVKPVAASLGLQSGDRGQGDDRGTPPSLRPRVAGVTVSGSRAQPSLEVLAAVRPELMLADAFVHRDLSPQLARTAPTAAFQSRRGSLDDLNAQTLLTGQMVGRAAAARQLLADQRSLIAKARAFSKAGAPGFVAAVVTTTSLTVHTDQSFAGSVLGALGRRDLPGVKDGPTQDETSLEGLAGLNPGSPVLFTAFDETPLTDTWKVNPLWKKLRAVQRGRVYPFDHDNWTRGRGPLALKLRVKQAIDSRLLQDAAPPKAYSGQPTQ